MRRIPIKQEELEILAKAFAAGHSVGTVGDFMASRGYPKRTRKAYENLYYRLRNEVSEPDLASALGTAEPDARVLRAKLREMQDRERLADRVIKALEEYIRPIERIKIQKTKPSSVGQTECEAVSVLSDEHADKIISREASWGLEFYNFDIFRARLERWIDVTVSYMTAHLPRHKFSRHWIFKLGDSVEGQIHDAEKRGYFGNCIRAAIAVADVEAEAILRIHAQTGVPITIVAVSGNHGRRTVKKDYPDPTGTWDYLIAAIIARRLQGQPGIQVIAPRAWTAFVNVMGHLCSLNHGDDIRGTWGISWYGVDRRTNRLQAVLGKRKTQLRYSYYGHFHQNASVPAAATNVFFNGSFLAGSEYSMEALAVASDPMQLMHVFTEKHGRILEIPIELRDEKAEAELQKGLWRPSIGSDLILDDIEPVVTDGLHVIG